MNSLSSLYPGVEDQIVLPPEGIPYRTGIRGEPTSELRYLPSRFTTPVEPNVPLTPEQQADLALAAQRRNYDSGGGDSSTPTSPGPTSSPTMGSSGGLGGIAQSLGGAVASMQNTFGPFAAAVPGYGLMNAMSNIGQDLAIDANARADAALAKANEQANYAKVTSPYFSFGPQVTTAVDISPVAPPAAQEVTPIAPDVVAPGIPVTDVDVNVDPTAALTEMNQQTQAEQAQATPASIAATVADAVTSFADTQDQEAGQNVGAPAGTTADQGGGGGGGGGGGVGEGGGFSVSSQDVDASMDAGDPGGGTTSDGAENSGVYFKGGRVMNYQSGGLMGMGDSQPQYAYAPTMMASGGLPAAAKKVQAQGRNGDSTLVHMTQGEVKGLDAIARAYGGRVTINPETGLPEANFLKSILPMVAGAALAATGVGAPMAAMLVGGGSYLMNPEKGLMGGLMAGLGAYGGAGLFGALGAAGATAPAVTGTNAALQSVAATPGANIGNIAAQQAADSAINVVAAPSSVVGGTNFAGNLAQAGRGVTALGTEAGRSAAMQSLGGPMGAVQTVGAAAAPMTMVGPETPDMGNFGGTPTRIRPYKFTRTARPDAFTSRPESSEKRYFDEEYTALPTTEVLRYAMGGGINMGGRIDPDYNENVDRNSGFSDDFYGGGLTAFNSGGLQDGGFVVPADVVAHLGNGSTTAGQKVLARGLGARPIKGKGDGMSDSIPTTIEGKQPARVADGEAYVPAEKVKEVGPKRLYKMMEKVRQARTNSARQAPAINPSKYIPA